MYMHLARNVQATMHDIARNVENVKVQDVSTI